MRTKHRIPTLFTLSMLDVFCCALGCVILLWLWNDRLAKSRAKAAGETYRDLSSTRDELAKARTLLVSMKGDLASAQSTIASLTHDLDAAARDLTGARKDLADRLAELTNAHARATDLNDRLSKAKEQVNDLTDLLASTRSKSTELSQQLSLRTREQRQAAADMAELLRKKQEQDKAAAALAESLAKKNKDEDALKSQADVARRRIADLEMLTRDKEAALSTAAIKSKELSERLNDAEGQLRLVRAKAETASSLQSNLDEQMKRLTAAESRTKDLEKFLSNRKSVMIDMQGKIDELQGDRRVLSDQLAKIKVAADNRFAGIQLTGRRVVFLVDMSGSMKMVDENTAAPEKWAGVHSTVEKVMKSLPDLEKFQIVLFSDGVSFPVGDGSEWIDFSPENSSAWAKQVLSKIEPKGNTNMYAAFEAAFRFRAKGLDTIYLLSDGLPNAGPGLSPLDQTRNLSESEKGDKLGKYIRGTLKQSWNRPTSGMANVRINSIGFFYESPEVGAFLWALSREHDGSFVGMSKP